MRKGLLLLLFLSSPVFAHNAVDIAMRIEAPAFVASQQTLAYRVVADDLANDNGFGIVVTDTLPAGVTFLDASGAGWNCSRSQLTVTCSAEQVMPGANPITIRVTAPRAPATLTNRVKVTSIGSFDPTAANDTAEHRAVVYDPAQCASSAPQLQAPAEGASLSGAVRLAWTPVAGAARYAVYASLEGERAHVVATTTAAFATIKTGRGQVEWWVEAQSDVCPSVASAKAHFEVAESALAFVPVPFAAFRAPAGIAVAPGGEMYVTDRDDDVVRRIDPDGRISVVAGTEGTAGAAEGEHALFRQPVGVAVTPLDGFTYVADSGNHAVRILYTGGALVTTYTVGGRLGLPGLVDDTSDKSQMNAPLAVAATERGSLYAADTGNNAVRKLTPVSGYVGYFSLSTVATGLLAPAGVAVDGEETVYVADTGNHVIRKIAGGSMTVFAGSVGEPGDVDGRGAAARFRSPAALAVDPRGNLYVCDAGNGSLRMISPSGLVTTLATALREPGGVAVDGAGRVWIAETGGRAVAVLVEVGPRRRAAR